ncbi:hypothetical protein AYO21_07207 [Fonsecaea monophora]|uniref:Clr5 domain-containing protein n=1 Tax=Fonsecaea monophora TaxID=254056 RepID=A0A177F2J0_9EURO|nr:hypothetical protein AYO21_07207 [Fonsecaea monophora]OAG38547.1 hypothetical protein AYO21_07207 [Fonsecaea monophora]
MPNPPAPRARTPARSTQSAVKKPSLPRKKGPSAEEWDRVKPLIERYYMEDGKKQKDILVLLSKGHQFVAADHMLKERLKQWGFKKNSTKQEHKAAAEEAKRCADLGLALPTSEKDGRSVVWDRVYRHFGSDTQYRCSLLQSDVGCKAMLSKISLKASPLDHKLERMLNEVRQHWCGTLEQAETSSWVIAKREAKTRPDIKVGFLSALKLYSDGDAAHARHEVNKVCLDIQLAFEQQHPDLMLEMIHLFTSMSWVIHAEVYAKATKYVRSLSANAPSLGPHHPLTRILDTFASLEPHMELLGTCAELALKLMMDLADAGGNRVKLDREYILSIETMYIVSLQYRLDRRDVKELLERKLTHYRRTLGERNRYTLLIESRLAKLYMSNASRARRAGERHDAEMWERQAEEIFAKFVKMGQKNPYDGLRNGMYISAAADLGRIHFARLDFATAQDYYCKALIWASFKVGRSHPYISLLLRDFRALQKMGELGLIGVPVEDKEDAQAQMTESAKDNEPQCFSSLEVCGGAPDEQAEIDYSHESFATFGDPTFFPLGPDFLPDLGNTSGQEVHDGNGVVVHSQFLDSHIDMAAQETFSEKMQGQCDDPSTWDLNAVSAGISLDLAAEAMSDEPVVGAILEPSVFFQEDPPQFKYDMDDTDRFSTWQ